jgi:hypothetical protein
MSLSTQHIEGHIPDLAKCLILPFPRFQRTSLVWMC